MTIDDFLHICSKIKEGFDLLVIDGPVFIPSRGYRLWSTKSWWDVSNAKMEFFKQEYTSGRPSSEPQAITQEAYQQLSYVE